MTALSASGTELLFQGDVIQVYVAQTSGAPLGTIQDHRSALRIQYVAAP